MKSLSPLRSRLNASVADFRRSMKERIGRCDHCCKPKAPEYLDLDEIARGCTRARALTEPCNLLCVCRPCHGIVQPWTRAKRLALLYLVRSEAYDLDRFYEITKRRFPDQESVDAEIASLLALRANPLTGTMKL